MGEPTVVLIHGQWMTGIELVVLQRRLQAQGFKTRQFHYRMVMRSLPYNCAQLNAFIGRHAPEGAHIVGHSLGGVLALHTLRRFADLRVDKVVCLGSPLVGSEAGRRFTEAAAGRVIMGRTLPEAVLDQPLREWRGRQPVGVIAGTRGAGLGRFFATLAKPNDGLVSLAETCLPGIADHLALPVSHTGLVLSQPVAEQCGWFLRHGAFRHKGDRA